MCWSKAAMREERQQAYFDSILMIISESSGGISRQQLIKKVARDLRKLGNTNWHVDRMVSTMLREKCLIRKGELLALNSFPGAQQNR
jgi:hypothetical protein